MRAAVTVTSAGSGCAEYRRRNCAPLVRPTVAADGEARPRRIASKVSCRFGAHDDRPLGSWSVRVATELGRQAAEAASPDHG